MRTTIYQMHIESDDRDAQRIMDDFVHLLDMDSSKSVHLLKRTYRTWSLDIFFNPEDVESDEDQRQVALYLGRVRNTLQNLCFDKTVHNWRHMN
jgi:hypothetical protein